MPCSLGTGPATISQRFQDQIFKEQEDLQQVRGRCACVCLGGGTFLFPEDC